MFYFVKEYQSAVCFDGKAHICNRCAVARHLMARGVTDDMYCKKNFNLYNIFLGFNTSTNEYTLTDDTVLEEHYEDPRLTQMKLVGGPEGNIFTSVMHISHNAKTFFCEIFEKN